LRVAKGGQVPQHNSSEKEANENGESGHRGDPPGVENDWIVVDDGKRTTTALAHFVAGQHTSREKQALHRVYLLKCAALCEKMTGNKPSFARLLPSFSLEA
jgi:hypothetical protein